MNLDLAYRSILDYMDEAVCVLDLQSKILYLNPAAKKLDGCGNLEPFGKPFNEVFCAESLNVSTSPLYEEGKQVGSIVFLKKASLSSAEEVKRRDRFLTGVALATNLLLTNKDDDLIINQALELLGYSADVDRVYIIENYDENGEHFHRLRYEWSRDDIKSQLNDSETHFNSYSSFPGWYETLAKGMPIKGLTRDLPETTREFHSGLGTLSFLVVPLFMGKTLWGFIGFHDCRSERRWTWGEVSILLTMAGTIGGILLNRQAENALAKEEKNYRELVEGANSIIMRRDISGKITFLNKFGLNFFGYPEDEIIGKNVVGTIVPAVDSEGRDLRKMIEDIGRQPENYAININENLRSNGDRAWIAWANRPILNEKGDVVEILCIGNDITDRKIAEEKLNAEHEQLLGIIEFLPDATFVIDRDKKVIAWNKAIEEMTGVSKEHIISKGDYIYGLPFYGEPRPMLIDLIDIEDKEIESKYIYIDRKDGRLFAETFVPSLFSGRGAYVRATASPLYNDKGEVIGSIESIRDITQMKLSADEIKRRDILLAGIAASANALLIAQEDKSDIIQALEILGLSANADRIYICENNDPEKDRIMSRIFEWCREGIPHQIDNPNTKNISYSQHFQSWYDTLKMGKTINGSIRDLTDSAKGLTEPEILLIKSQGILSLLMVPIIVEGDLWGFVCFDDCRTERIWMPSEISILSMAAASIGQMMARRSAEKALQRSEENYRALVENINDVIFKLDTQGRFTYMSPVIEQISGHKMNDIIGKPFAIFVHPDDLPGLQTSFERLLAGYLEPYEFRSRDKNGKYRHVRTSSRILMEDGQPTGFIGVLTDITEQKHAQEQIRFHASLLDQVHNAVIATDLNGRIIYWNKFAETLYQWKAEEIIGRNIFNTIVPENKISIVYDVISRIDKVGCSDGEFQAKRKDGSIFPAHYTFSAVKDLNERIIGYLGVSVDITERKRAEEELRNAKDAAESATRAKSDFLANMSHEIRTPMNAVIGLTGLMLNTELTPDQRDYVETIRSSGETLLALINDILDFSKIEGGKLELEAMPFDLIDCIEASIGLVAQAAARKGLSLSYSIEESVPTNIISDVTRLRQILANLLSNAVKFTNKGEISIIVSSKKEGDSDFIQFAIRDTGIGIPKDRMDRLFQSFSQIDTSMTRKYGGTGLGLAISKRLVELMDGSIWVESEEGKGSTFFFTINTKEAPCVSISKAAKKADIVRHKLTSDTGRSPLRILLAEDNIVNQKVGLRMLERLGYHADVAANGLEVIQALERESYDVILMDIQMPEMDGLEAARRIRMLPEGDQIYIIAITAHALKGDKETCFNAGMNDYISKPVRIEDLHDALEHSKARKEFKAALGEKKLKD